MPKLLYNILSKEYIHTINGLPDNWKYSDHLHQIIH